MKRLALLLSASSLLLLSACGSGGPVRRVSEPAASIQQLTVRADGSWSAELRIENFSSIPMRFDRFDLVLALGSDEAGRLQGTPAVSIGPESADVITLTMTPQAAAKIAVADALASGRTVSYTLRGRVDATPDQAKSRSFDIDRSSVLSPAPGLPGVLR